MRPDKRSRGQDAVAYDTVGLALSGGGIRSAAVSLGVLQALNHHDALRSVDYLSTVSGGGYIGASLTATMTRTGGDFVFGNRPRRETVRHPRAAEIKDTSSVGHLRNYSNYLIPAGLRDALTGMAIVMRGLVANAAIVLPLVLLAAAVTIWSNPYRSSLLTPDVLGVQLERYHLPSYFGVTLVVALFVLAGLLVWALYRSFLAPKQLSEFRGNLPFLGAVGLVLLGGTFFFELQPVVVSGMFEIADAAKEEKGGTWRYLTDAIKTLAAITAPLAAILAFSRQQIGAIIKSAGSEASWTTRLAALASKAALWLAGAAVPLLIWVAYLYLAYWGIINDAAPKLDEKSAPAAVQVQAQAAPAGVTKQFPPAVIRPTRCPPAAPVPCRNAFVDGCHTPKWMLNSAGWLTDQLVCWVEPPVPGRASTHDSFFRRHFLERPMLTLYLAAGIALFVLAWFLRSNANSLHRLYRDRLSKAFLFDPRRHKDARPARGSASLDQGRDFAPLDSMRVSELRNHHTPYHLINAALNIQGSDYANRRGRNADFFLFSPCFVGSHATSYAPTVAFEKAAPDLDLATAMAISGAAASSNMGGKSIKSFAATLALLNVRLGYWLKNPRYVLSRPYDPWHWLRPSSLFLWSEISGRLYENSSNVYLTDGGHIENLGIYQLLRRRCRVIVVVDAEADPDMRLASFIQLQRYARIDLGIRIQMPWGKICEDTLACMDPGVKTQPAKGPHAAIGIIDYGGGAKGYLLYLKASLTGDEADYIRDYGRRYRWFPHESTSDQMFTEEQFEVYRALGFHIVHGIFCGSDVIEVEGGTANMTFHSANPAVKAVRGALRS